MSKGRLIQGVKHALPDCVVKSSKGSYVTTECGRKFLDFTCGMTYSPYIYRSAILKRNTYKYHMLRSDINERRQVLE